MSSQQWISVSLPYVTPRSRAERDAWGAEAAGQGGIGSQRLMGVSEVVPSAEIAEALRVKAGELVVLRRRMMLLNDQPVELTDSYYPADIARGTGLAQARKIRGGAVTLLAELGHRAHRVEEDVYARQPTDGERLALTLGDHDWVLGLTRLLLKDDGVPVELSVMTMVAQGRRLRYQLTVD